MYLLTYWSDGADGIINQMFSNLSEFREWWGNNHLYSLEDLTLYKLEGEVNLYEFFNQGANKP